MAPEVESVKLYIYCILMSYVAWNNQRLLLITRSDKNPGRIGAWSSSEEVKLPALVNNKIILNPFLCALLADYVGDAFPFIAVIEWAAVSRPVCAKRQAP